MCAAVKWLVTYILYPFSPLIRADAAVLQIDQYG